jgi:hypothetical protein
MTTKTSHTPTPWKWYRNYHCPGPLKGAFIDDAAGTCRIADILSHGGVGTQEVTEANAAHIVRCVNEREGLLTALRDLANVVIYASSVHRNGNKVSPQVWLDLYTFGNIAHAVLDSAEREEG